jgi:hypothetical protein
VRQKKYPYLEGNTQVLGPEIFAALDGSVISWRGVNYVPQAQGPVAEPPDPRADPLTGCLPVTAAPA